MTSDSDMEKNLLAEKIAGEIVLSESPGETIKKWRTILRIPQKELSRKMGITQSVVSDYESGRRKSPGTGFIKKVVMTIISIEMEKGSNILAAASAGEGTVANAILDIREFTEPVCAEKFCASAGCEIISKDYDRKKEIYGYTVIDSLAAIVSLPPSELVKIYGSSKERALIFTKVSTGRSPMVAIKVTGIRPAMVIFQGTDQIDDVAMKIGHAEKIILARATEKSSAALIESLKKAFS